LTQIFTCYIVCSWAARWALPEPEKTMLTWLFGTKEQKCALRGHPDAVENSRRFVPEHPKNDADFAVVEIAYECPHCHALFSKTRLSFRGGVLAFLHRGRD
jgi:hypothetical protein